MRVANVRTYRTAPVGIRPHSADGSRARAERAARTSTGLNDAKTPGGRWPIRRSTDGGAARANDGGADRRPTGGGAYDRISKRLSGTRSSKRGLCGNGSLCSLLALSRSLRRPRLHQSAAAGTYTVSRRGRSRRRAAQAAKLQGRRDDTTAGLCLDDEPAQTAGAADAAGAGGALDSSAPRAREPRRAARRRRRRFGARKRPQTTPKKNTKRLKIIVRRTKKRKKKNKALQSARRAALIAAPCRDRPPGPQAGRQQAGPPRRRGTADEARCGGARGQQARPGQGQTRPSPAAACATPLWACERVFFSFFFFSVAGARYRDASFWVHRSMAFGGVGEQFWFRWSGAVLLYKNAHMPSCRPPPPLAAAADPASAARPAAGVLFVFPGLSRRPRVSPAAGRTSRGMAVQRPGGVSGCYRTLLGQTTLC